MLQNSEFSPNLLNVCGELFKRLENRDLRNDCVKEILESQFEGKLSEQDYICYQFLKVLNEMYKEGFDAGKKLSEAVGQEANDAKTMGAYLHHKISTRRKVSDSFAMQIAPVIKNIKDKGAKTLQEIADQLTGLGIKTVSGYDRWHPATVRHVEKKIAKRLLKSEYE